MRLNETTATARRVGPLLALDASGDPVIGETFADAGELEVNIAGTGWVPAGGTITEMGGGYYYYEATPAEAATRPHLGVKIGGTACEEFTFRENIERVPAGIQAGVPAPIGPLLALDASGDPVIGETFAGAGELEVSINGAAWSAPLGTISEDTGGEGYYHYAPHPDEIPARGWITVKIGGTACEEFTFREDVIDDEVKPVITYVSPTPGVAPGAAGGFPADPSAAKTTPIVIQLSDANPGTQYVAVGVRYTDQEGNEIEETVYRRNNFRGRYVEGSKQEMVGSALQLTIKRDGGWLELIQGATKQFEFFADVVDAAGNVSAEE